MNLPIVFLRPLGLRLLLVGEGGWRRGDGWKRWKGIGGVGRNRWGRRRTEDGAARVWTRAALIREGDERDDG